MDIYGVICIASDGTDWGGVGKEAGNGVILAGFPPVTWCESMNMASCLWDGTSGWWILAYE